MLRVGTLLALLLLAPGARAGGWLLVGERDGVTTWAQEVPGSALLGFRGRATVDLHVSRLVGAALDSTRAPQWVDLLAEQRILADDGTTQVLYQRYDMAWPVADRDLVLRRTVHVDPRTHRTTIALQSVRHPDAPEVPGVVRARVDHTWIAFRSLPGGRTEVEVEAFTDPRGAVPAWLVNLVQKTWARNSITALVGLARRDGVEPYPAVRDW